ncbi:MAG: hypothetical protein KDA55_13870 [Planctomycetales bacterium]|nr:hypothetical protein [Planctomycetales bacterium]MCA9209446.1 hypothetical protein [Planctomycetales bacterium]
MKTETQTQATMTVAASVAPEDLRCGDFVAVLSEVIELPSFLWFGSLPFEQDEPMRTRFLPTDAGTPLKVRAICLPFVFVESPSKDCQTLDVRRVQLARLAPSYAQNVWTRQRKQLKKRSNQSQQSS